MFFTFPKRKIINITLVLVVLVFGASVGLALIERYDAQEMVNLYARRAREDVLYWLTNRVKTQGLASAISYQSASELAKSIPVLTYHGLPQEGGDGNPFSPQDFSEHMRALYNAGWRTITLDQFEAFIRGRIDLPERSFLLTFDDGRKDTFYPADPVLRDLGMNAVMFAITKRSVSPTEEQSPYYLSPYELKVMEKSDRWEVESHGRDSHDWYYIIDDGAVGHFFSNLLWLEEDGRLETPSEFRERIAYDLETSKADLESTLDKRIRAFAYPFGDFGQDGENYAGAVDVVREETDKNYQLAFYQVWNGVTETFNYPSVDRVMMRRIEPLGQWSGDYLVTLLESGLSKDLPFSAVAFGEEWRSAWGNIEKGEVLSLSAYPSTTGAATALNGSWWWRDYTFTTDALWSAGSNIVLIARKDDDQNYFGCNFGRGRVYVKTVVGGVSRNLADAVYSAPSREIPATLGVSVDGDRVSCLVNGSIVLDAPGVNTRIANGGIGFEIWDEELGAAHAIFDNIQVVEN